MSDRLADAQQCVDEEYQAVDNRLAAIKRFLSRVSSLQTTGHVSTQKVSAPGQTASFTAPADDDACRAVRTIFSETIGSISTPDMEHREPASQTLSEELSEPVAFALAPGSNGTFTPELKQEVIRHATSRKVETKVLKQVLKHERSLLDETISIIEDLSAALGTVESESFEALSFPALQAHHETLDTHRSKCCEFVAKRQSFLQDTTAQLPQAEIEHRTFVLYLYQGLPVDHPVLAAITELDDSLAATQQDIRDQLIRTV